jgi:FtsH-binding integral membrane protein
MNTKLIVMNLVGGVAWLLLGIALYPSHFTQQSLNVPLSAILLYAMIALVPLKTAFVLYKKNKFKQNLIAQAFNYALIIFFVFSYIGIVLTEKSMFTKMFDLPLFISLFVIVIPSFINLRALKQLRN